MSFNPFPDSQPPSASTEPNKEELLPQQVPASDPNSMGYQAALFQSLPDDLRVPWGWLDILLLAVIAFGSTFLFGILVVLGMTAIGIPIAQIQKSPADYGLVAVIAQILADVSILGYLALQLRHRFQLPFWKAIGWRPVDTGKLSRGVFFSTLVFGGCVMALVVGLLDSAFPSKEKLPIESLLQDHRTAILFMLTAVFVAPVVEETIFRGYLYPVCARTWGILPGILVTGTLFGLLHSLQLWGGWWQIGCLILVGIALTATRAFTKTVVASCVVHASYNALPVIAYVLTAVRLHHFPAPQ